MRRWMFLLAVVAAVIAASGSLVGRARATGTPASLNNEGLVTLSEGMFSGSCSPNTPDQVIGFSASGTTGEHPYTLEGPPYPGTFTETGSVTIDTTGATQVTAVSATFSISAGDGTQIAGTISFESADGSTASCGEVYVYPTYTATITTPGPNSQTCTDTGHVEFDLDPTGTYFSQGFDSNGSLSCSTQQASTVTTGLVLANQPPGVTSIPPGGQAYDTATLANVTSDAGGTLTYYYGSPAACANDTGTSAGAVTVTNGSVPHSAVVTFPTPGSYAFWAVYSGDGKNAPATSGCEPFTVLNRQPSTLKTSLVLANQSAGVTSIPPGGQAYDTATLGSVTRDAGGTLTYYYGSAADCSSGLGFSAGAVTVANGAVPHSAVVTFTTPGPYAFWAVYSGDGKNAPATSSCEPFTVRHLRASTLTTGLVLANQPTGVTSIPPGGQAYDMATLGNVTRDAGGTLTYYYGAAADCSSGLGFSLGAVTVANGTVPHSAVVTLTTPGKYAFWVVYSGDGKNAPATSSCEPLTVRRRRASTLTTSLVLANQPSGATSVPRGGQAYDMATLGSVTSDAGGTLTYYYGSAADCNSGLGFSAGVFTVQNGSVLHSAVVTFPTPGAYAFWAVYSGDGKNAPATSSCKSLTVR